MSEKNTNEFDPAEIMGLMDKFKNDLNQSKSKVMNEIEARHNMLLESEEAQEAFLAPFLKLDSWELFAEAVPICLGYDVNDAKSGCVQSKSEYQALMRLVRSSVGVSLKVLNPEEKDIKWRVQPKAFLRWLDNKGVQPISKLSGFFLEESKVDNKFVSAAQSERHAVKREEVYIAVIAILANFNDQCRNSKGEVSPTNIERIMSEKSPLWFGENEPPLSPRVIKDLISRAIRTASK